MNKSVSYSDIKSFLVLVESGSFTNAAETLRCSRSHISKQLTQLESDLGVSLLVRTTRTQHLTDAGEIFYDKCKQSFLGIESAIDRAKEQASSLSGKLKINSVGGYIGENIIGPLVSDFMKAHPEVSVVLDFSSQRVDLVSGEFDFVFRMGELFDSSLIARKLTDIEVGTFASPAYIEKYGRPAEPKSLVSHKCIAGSMNQWSFVHASSKARQNVSVNADLSCKNGRVMLHSALLGNGIIRVPNVYCSDEVQQGLLVPIFKNWQPEPTPFYLLYLKDKHQPARVIAFKDFVSMHFAKYFK
ncbi:LysR family transcriptional regulator [Pseudoalteromonas obscura]|uniref:LysR family transcriptional regulator n=1 Tax=Pseudoalteromonas obscura TaxID=3048491 RepID=A0ABT7EKQ5_9GAMM|nr:LysR family transcriptional regulator [Pseudoalteromonas sp. P94(2023)]MDK2595639.1 LysR family transcriptional regulator [Pseudoalteromonas sp. P94(2023)]